jgi:hypothetical protein
MAGVPWRISYDNLSAAVRLMGEGRVRREQRQFVALRSYYLFESHFCQPAAGWEKGGVEASVLCRHILHPRCNQRKSDQQCAIFSIRSGRQHSSKQLAFKGKGL